MAEIYQPLQIEGTDPPRYRQVSYSDEAPPEDRTFWALCNCPDGHESEDAARACPVVVSKMDGIFEKPEAPEARAARVYETYTADDGRRVSLVVGHQSFRLEFEADLEREATDESLRWMREQLATALVRLVDMEKAR